MVPDRLKKIIFRKLYNDLSHVEIIPFNNSTWFVDRDEKYWYFELQKDGTLWWRYQFFSDFFIMFSLVRDEFQSILAEWVEEVLNSRVDKTIQLRNQDQLLVEEVLNSRINTTALADTSSTLEVEEVLNSRVDKTLAMNFPFPPGVEEVFNSRVIKISEHYFKESETVEDVLNSRVNKTISVQWYLGNRAEEVLNSRVIKTYKLDIDSFTRVEEVLNSKVNTTPCVSGALQEKVDEVLNCGDSAPTIGERLSHKVSQAKEGELFDESIVDTVLSSLT